MTIRAFLLCGVLAGAFVLAGCNDEPGEEDCTISGDQAIELSYPTGGETFTVGDEVTMKWKVDKDRVGGAVPFVSLDGRSWNTIPTSEAVFVDEDGPRYQCQSYTWVIGSEGERPDYEGAAANGPITTVRVRISPYQAPEEPSKSEAITVKLQ